MSIHNEILAAATSLGFKPQRDGEPDATYLGRLALAANSLPDSEWSCLTPEAIEWVNASAKRLNSGKQVEVCPGFGDDSGFATSDDVEEQEVSEKVPAENIALDTGGGDSNSVYLAIDPELMGVSGEDHLLGFFNNTDRLRGLVMLHPEWTHADFKKAMGGDVKAATLNTVRSVTLATIAVAKRLGLWRTA